MISAESDVRRHCFHSFKPIRPYLPLKHAARRVWHILLTQKLHPLSQHQQIISAGACWWRMVSVTLTLPGINRLLQVSQIQIGKDDDIYVKDQRYAYNETREYLPTISDGISQDIMSIMQKVCWVSQASAQKSTLSSPKFVRPFFCG